MTARPAAARLLGGCEETRALVEAVSAASSADRRESWEAAKAEGSSGVGVGIVVWEMYMYTLVWTRAKRCMSW